MDKNTRYIYFGLILAWVGIFLWEMFHPFTISSEQYLKQANAHFTNMNSITKQVNFQDPWTNSQGYPYVFSPASRVNELFDATYFLHSLKIQNSINGTISLKFLDSVNVGTLVILLFAMAGFPILFRKKEKKKSIPKLIETIKVVEEKSIDPPKVKEEDTEIVGSSENNKVNINEKPVCDFPFYLLPQELSSWKHPNLKIITPGFIKTRTLISESSENIFIPEINKKREEIFNEDLKQIIRKVTSKHPVENNIFQSWIDKLIPEGSEELYKSLNHLYDNDYFEFESLSYFSRIMNKTDMSSISIHLMHKIYGCYMTTISTGIDAQSAKNMIFEKNDVYLKKTEEGLVKLEFNDELLNDQFFRKKFSDNFIKLYSCMIGYPLFRRNVDGYLFLFLRKGHPMPANMNELYTIIHDMTAPVIPLINGILKSKLEPVSDHDDILQRNIMLMKEVTENGKKRAEIVKISLINLAELNDWKAKKKQLMDTVLEVSPDGVIMSDSSPNELLLFRPSYVVWDVKKMFETSKELGINIKYEFRIYPEHGSSYFNYI